MVESGERTLQRGQTIPDFTLLDINGETVSSRSVYMRRNHVVALLPESAEPCWNEWLTLLSAAVHSIPDRDVACFMIFPEGWREEITDLYSNGNQVKLLIDRDRSVGNRFGHDRSEGTLIIADRYGDIFHIASGGPKTPELDPSEIPDWIEFIACRCS